MIDSDEINWTAYLLVREFNDDAANQAIKMMNAMLAKGDMEGEQAWRWVLQAGDRIEMQSMRKDAA